MKHETFVNIAVEDALSEHVLRAVFSQTAPHLKIANVLHQGGYGYIKRIIKGLNHAARGMPYFVLTDLDKGACPASLITEWLGTQPVHVNLSFRIAVTEVDAWLFAHRGAFVSFLGIRHLAKKIPADSETIEDPKRLLINLCKHSKISRIRKAIVPEGTAKIGPGYNDEMAMFVERHWDARAAAGNSDSLDRAIKKFRTFRFLSPENA
jgi:hypothetical protein